MYIVRARYVILACRESTFIRMAHMSILQKDLCDLPMCTVLSCWGDGLFCYTDEPDENVMFSRRTSQMLMVT